jgi:hypothetical protein
VAWLRASGVTNVPDRIESLLAEVDRLAAALAEAQNAFNEECHHLDALAETQEREQRVRALFEDRRRRGINSVTLAALDVALDGPQDGGDQPTHPHHDQEGYPS